MLRASAEARAGRGALAPGAFASVRGAARLSGGASTGAGGGEERGERPGRLPYPFTHLWRVDDARGELEARRPRLRALAEGSGELGAAGESPDAGPALQGSGDSAKARAGSGCRERPRQPLLR